MKNTIRNYRVSSKKNMTISKKLHEIILGCLLGDLSCERKTLRNNSRLQFKQSKVNTLYIQHLYSLFKDYCGSKPINLKRFDNRPNKMKIYEAIKFQTLSLPCFNIYRESFYNLQGIKIVPLTIIKTMTAVSLAYWFMDDGYKGTTGYYIATESFTLTENEILAQVITTNFNIECKPHKTTNGYRLYIPSTSVKLFNSLIGSEILPHFNYKLHN